MNLFNKLIHFIKRERKQIIFALFALLCYLLDRDNSVGLLKSAAPVVAAAAVAGSTTTAAAGGTAAAAGTAAGASSAGAATSATAASTTTSAAATSSATAGNIGTAGATNSGMSVKSNAQISTMPRNTNPNPNAVNSQNLSSNSMNASESIRKNVGTELDPSTSKSSLKESSLSDVEKENKNRKDINMNVELGNNDDDEYEEQTMDNATKEITGDAGKSVVGCLFISVFISIFFIPVLVLLLINPTSSVMSQIDCEIFQTSNCVDGESEGTFADKLKNLFKYGSFGTNSEVISKKTTEISEKISEETGFIINMPLLLSSLLADGENLKNELNSDQGNITDKMLERLEYAEDLARLQIIEDYFVYNCNVKIVDGKEEYYKTTNYDNIDPTTITETKCNESTVGGVFKEISNNYDEEVYFEKLEESELLDEIYSEYTESDSLLVSKIKVQYQLYKSLYLNKEEEEIYPEVPQTLFYDENVNLQSPLRGWYSITSPFGNRTGQFAGMHVGIDLVASDKTIYAAGDGVVTRSNVETEGGNVVEITHTASNGDEYVSQYAHLSQRLVNVGDTVKSGDIIGIMGDTGTMASGVHLHFSMWTKSPKEYLNPKSLFTGASNY